MNRDSESGRPVHRLRARLRAATEEAILGAAEEVFAEQGLHAARMESIAERAGVAVGTLYNHFKDRAALLEALMGVRREALFARMDAVLAEVEGQPFRAQLEAFLGAIFAHFGEHARFFAIAVQSEALPRPPQMRSPTWMMLERKVQELLRRASAAGELRGEDPELLAAALQGMVRGALMKGLVVGNGDGLSRWASLLADLFLHGAGVR